MYAFVTIKNNDSQKVTIVDLEKEDLEETFTDIFADKWEPSQIVKMEKFCNFATTTKEFLERTYSCLSEHNLIDEIQTEEEMREFCLYHIKQGNNCAHTLLSVEDNPGCEYFGFDMTGWSDMDAEPFYCAEDMIEYVI